MKEFSVNFFIWKVCDGAQGFLITDEKLHTQISQRAPSQETMKMQSIYTQSRDFRK